MTPDPRIILLLDPEPTGEDLERLNLLGRGILMPSTMGGAKRFYPKTLTAFAAHRAAAARQAIELTAQHICMQCCARRIDEALAAHDLAIKERA